MSLGIGSLVNTLSGLNANTFAEALRREQEQMLVQQAQEAAAAQAAASEAAQQYQQAAAAPPPEVSAQESFIPTLFSNIASVIAQDPSFRQRAQQEKQTQQQALMQARSQNLQALRDVYSQRAEAAQRAGDLETQEKFRLKHEQISRTLDKLGQAEGDQRQHEQAVALERLRQQGRATETEAEHRARLSEIAAQGAQQRQTQAAKPAVSGPERAAMARAGVNPDSGLMLTTFGHREVTRRLALAKRGDRASRDEAFNGALDIAVQRWDTDKTPRDMARRIASIQHPFYGATPKDARYALTGDKIWRKVKGKFEKDPAAAAAVAARVKEIVLPWFTEPAE